MLYVLMLAVRERATVLVEEDEDVKEGEGERNEVVGVEGGEESTTSSVMLTGMYREILYC